MATTYVGWTSREREDWKSFAPPVKAPSNYRDPVKIKEYVDEREQIAIADARTGALTGRLLRVVTIDVEGEKSEIRDFDLSSGADGPERRHILLALAKTLAKRPRVVGLGVREFLKIAACEFMPALSIADRQEWLVADLLEIPMDRGRGKPLMVFDPKDVFLPKADFYHPPAPVNLPKVLERFSMQARDLRDPGVLARLALDFDVLFGVTP